MLVYRKPEQITYTRRMDTKRYRETEILVDKYDDLSEITSILYEFLGVEAGVIRVHCDQKPNVMVDDNLVLVFLHWSTAHQLNSDKLIFNCTDLDISETIYETVLNIVSKWYNGTLVQENKKRN